MLVNSFSPVPESLPEVRSSVCFPCCICLTIIPCQGCTVEAGLKNARGALGGPLFFQPEVLYADPRSCCVALTLARLTGGLKGRAEQRSRRLELRCCGYRGRPRCGEDAGEPAPQLAHAGVPVPGEVLHPHPHGQQGAGPPLVDVLTGGWLPAQASMRCDATRFACTTSQHGGRYRCTTTCLPCRCLPRSTHSRLGMAPRGQPLPGMRWWRPSGQVPGRWILTRATSTSSSRHTATQTRAQRSGCAPTMETSLLVPQWGEPTRRNSSDSVLSVGVAQQEHHDIERCSVSAVCDFPSLLSATLPPLRSLCGRIRPAGCDVHLEPIVRRFEGVQRRPHIQVHGHTLFAFATRLSLVEVHDVAALRATPSDNPVVAVKRGVVPARRASRRRERAR